MTKKDYCLLLAAGAVAVCAGCAGKNHLAGHTEITRWQNAKKGALSLTFDDGNRNQFRVALPILERLKLPATFYVITGAITGSAYPGRFIGRPVKEIIRESASVPTGRENYFERASAAKYLGYKGAFAYYDRSAGLFEAGKLPRAYRVMDSLYADVRKGILKPGVEYSMEMADERGLTWDSIEAYAAKGYEFSSHTVTHTHLAVLDTANIHYELRKSKEDIRNHLGEADAFDAEIPFGIEHPRAMKYALPEYAALRNLMTDPWLKEINRGHPEPPGQFPEKAYVQWQRGPLSRTPYGLMTSWIDTTLAHDHIWLVLVFHGVDSLGWEPIGHRELETYFSWIKSREDSLWIATFGEVARYMREKMATQVQSGLHDGKIEVRLSDTLDPKIYDVPLTLKTYLPADWKNARAQQGSAYLEPIHPGIDAKGRYVTYNVSPGSGPVELSQAN